MLIVEIHTVCMHSYAKPNLRKKKKKKCSPQQYMYLNSVKTEFYSRTVVLMYNCAMSPDFSPSALQGFFEIIAAVPTSMWP